MFSRFLLPKIHRNCVINYDLTSPHLLPRSMSDQSLIVIACVEFECPSGISPQGKERLSPPLPYVTTSHYPLKEKNACYMIKTNRIEELRFQNYDLDSARILKVT